MTAEGDRYTRKSISYFNVMDTGCLVDTMRPGQVKKQDNCSVSVMM